MTTRMRLEGALYEKLLPPMSGRAVNALRRALERAYHAIDWPLGRLEARLLEEHARRVREGQHDAWLQWMKKQRKETE